MDEDSAADFANVESVFLDRDEALSHNPDGAPVVTCWEEFELLPGQRNFSGKGKYFEHEHR